MLITPDGASVHLPANRHSVGGSPSGRYPLARKVSGMFGVRQPKSSSHSLNDRFVIALHSPELNFQTGPTLSRPEKKAAKLAFQLKYDTFSKSGFSVKHAELRAFPPNFRGMLQSFSAPETCWRRERDSNPRYGFPYSGFQDRLFQPLTHPSNLLAPFSLHSIRPEPLVSR